MSVKQKSPKVNSLVFAVGFTAIAGQLAFIRLITQSFSGNELSMCIAIGHWMLWTGIGSLLGTRFIRRDFLVKNLFGVIALYVTLLVITSNLLLVFRRVIGIELSEVLGLGRIFFWTGLMLLPSALINGLFFPVCTRWIDDRNIGYPIHRVYICETVGSAFGGIVFILLVAAGMPTVYLVNLVAFFLLTVSSWILLKLRKFRILTTLIALLSIGLLSVAVTPVIERAKWAPYRVQEIRESPHQVITALSYAGDQFLFSNNEPLWSFGIEENAEEVVHFALLSHPEPRHILIIGPLFQDITDQIAKYPSVESITSVQGDEILDKFSRQIGSEPPDLGVDVRRIVDDPIRFIKNSEACFDVVILNIPLPVNIAWNIYYSREFLMLLRDHLQNAAVVSMCFPGSETYLNDDQIQFFKVMENTVRAVFDHSGWIPGFTLHLLASDQPLHLNFDAITAELQFRNIKNQYIQKNYLWDRLSPMKMDFLLDRIARCETGRLNSIKKPVAFYYSTVLWDQQTGGFLRRIYPWFEARSPWLFGVLFFAVGLIVIIILNRLQLHAATSKMMMALVGFSIMSLESVVLIAMQSYVGALYLRIALLSMAFMLGAASGAAWERRRQFAQNRRQLRIAGAALLLINIIYGLLLFHNSLILNFPGCHYLALLSCGFMSGMIFPILSQRIKSLSATSAASAGGSIYAWDIIGSCLGIYITSGLIIPVYGLMAVIAQVAAILVLLLIALLSFNG